MTEPHVLGGRFVLGDVLGYGGMSEVRRATDTELERDVAVKIMRSELARDATFYERFRREAQNSAVLTHPSIVRVFDTGEEQVDGATIPYIVMELVEGRTLRDIVRADDEVEPKLALAIMADACGALDFSHRKGIVHRDVKPANIMVTSDGAVKVMDFGIARAISEYTSTLTETSAVLGTAQYLSPEQAQGLQVDGRSDVYSAGCVLYELLTGRPPFVGESAVAVAYQHVKEDPNPPSMLRPDLDPYIDAVVMAAMSKNVNNRYLSAGEMRSDLLDVLAGRKPSAPMVMVPESGNGGAGPAAAGAAGAAGLGAAAGYGAGGDIDYAAPGSLGQEDTSAGETNTRLRALGGFRGNGEGARALDPVSQRRRKGLLTGVAALVVMALVGGMAWMVWGRDDGSDDPAVAEQAQQVTVPDVAGKPGEEAVAELTDLGFTVETREQTDPVVPNGQVITTDPVAGKLLVQGATITVVVSTGKRMLDVPSVTGQTPDEARRTLIEAGLTVANEDRSAPSTPEDEGRVIATDPTGGTSIPFDQPIQLTVGTGPEEVSVPDVVGQSVDAARSTLTSLGFRVETSEVDSKATADRVVDQSTPAGIEQVKGATITLQVSRGNRFTVPSLINLTVEDAEEALRAAGWKGNPDQLVQQPQNDTDITRIGKIASQTPAPGDAGVNDTITVRVIRLGLP